MKTYGGIAPCIPNLAVTAMPPGHALVTNLGGLQRRSGRCGEEQSLLTVPGTEP